MDEIEHWLMAREATFFSRLGCDFLDSFEQVGLESKAFDVTAPPTTSFPTPAVPSYWGDED
ncbi:MAG: hypothetical protein NTV94_18075, partial [Planctomycetota bacterium]|nr:hypothetical protein [Planctomycetota bacterium]